MCVYIIILCMCVCSVCTNGVVIDPFLVSSQSVAVQNLNVCSWPLRRHVKTEILFKLQLSQISEPKFLHKREGGREGGMEGGREGGRERDSHKESK